MLKRTAILLLAALLPLAPACAPHDFAGDAGYPPIFPDYIGVTVPEGIAPLTFRMEDGRKFRTEAHRAGDTLWTTVSAWKRGDRQGVRYAPFPIIFCCFSWNISMEGTEGNRWEIHQEDWTEY